MMKFEKLNILGVLLTISLAALVLQIGSVSAHGATLTGKACSLKASVKVYQGVKYTCVLSKKRLVWNKGVVVISKPSAKPTQSPSPLPALTENELLAKDILDLYQKSESNKSFTFEIRNCPNVNKTKADETVAAYERAMKFWTNFYTPTQAMKWVMFSQSDYDCWLSAVKDLEGDSGDTKVWDPVTNIMGHCQLSPGAFCCYGTGVKQNGNFVQYNAIGMAYSRSPEPSVVHHEAVHFYQMALQSHYIKTSKYSSVPPWFSEGQANLIGMTIAYKGVATSHRNFEIGRLKKVMPRIINFTAQEWADELKSLDSKHNFVFQNELGYSLGWFALEKVYQLYGIQKMHDLVFEINNGSTFDEALQKVLSTNREILYLAIGEYLAKEI